MAMVAWRRLILSVSKIEVGPCAECASRLNGPMGVHVRYADPPLTRIVPKMGVHVGYADPPLSFRDRRGQCSLS